MSYSNNKSIVFNICDNGTIDQCKTGAKRQKIDVRGQDKRHRLVEFETSLEIKVKSDTRVIITYS